MPNVCFYFQVHQPWRLRRYSLFEVGENHDYFSDEQNRRIITRVAEKCYLPANRLMLELIHRHHGRFQIAYSISGVAIEQMRRFAPAALQSFRELAATGCVEFLGETYFHSLASLADEDEFREQVREHSDLIEATFGKRPRVFRNTELIYNDRIGELAAELGFAGVACEGADDVLGWRSPNFVYRHPHANLKLLLKNYRLSDDIAFRFSNRGWPEFPLTTEKFSGWLHRINGGGEIVNLFMDYETFGEHQWSDTGIFEFMRALPQAVMRDHGWGFLTPSQALGFHAPVAEMPYKRTVSWADTERDISAWLGNELQTDAFKQLYDLGRELKARNNPAAIGLWRRLQTSDHFYYMCTKWYADGDVHAYFSPYESPYEAYLNFMNVIADLRQSVLWRRGLAAGRLVG
ncbi:MAG: polysaccharide deacetylase family protein [Planctomycetes bacterium]|nr:polysaccharide deacetylase family protein [Planctomycetota bacterium]